jgi:hypothetical protein
MIDTTNGSELISKYTYITPAIGGNGGNGGNGE